MPDLSLGSRWRRCGCRTGTRSPSTPATGSCSAPCSRPTCGPTTRMAVFEGVEDWLGNFIPFHDTCAWTVHEITNHVVGSDGQGVWATCYGWIRWTMKDTPGYINRAEVLFRDRLREDEGSLADRPADAAAAFRPSRRRRSRPGTTWSSPCSTWPTGRSGALSRVARGLRGAAGAWRWSSRLALRRRRLRRFLLLSPGSVPGHSGCGRASSRCPHRHHAQQAGRILASSWGLRVAGCPNGTRCSRSENGPQRHTITPPGGPSGSERRKAA